MNVDQEIAETINYIDRKQAILTHLVIEAAESSFHRARVRHIVEEISDALARLGVLLDHEERFEGPWIAIGPVRRKPTGHLPPIHRGIVIKGPVTHQNKEKN